MVGGDAVILCKAQNVADGNAVDDLGGRKPIDLFGKDMLQPGVIVREDLPHLLAAVKALDDFCDVQAGLHVGVEKGLARVIKAAGVFLLQQVHHLFHHPLGGEDLVGFLGRDVVEDILGAALVKVVRQLDLQVQKLLHRIVKHHRVEQVACKVLLLSGGLVDVRPAVPQKAELFQRDAGDLLRESYLLDTLECGDFTFATACLLANRKYGKNTQHGDIKSHQYIISFDPRDAADNGLTMEKAQALGLKFCEENFPGHPAIVCTHPDGHNHSGNIHVHIVIGSIRTREVERKPYMQKPRDWREGMKHSSTAQTMRHLRVEVMELCEGAGLYQIDLLNGSKERVNEAEYWARRRGQMKLDCENAALTTAGQPPQQKKFETVKDTLRKQISSVLYRAVSFEDFSDRLMQQYGIAVKESRGQLSYLPAGSRTKFIRAKHLGDKFDKAAVLATLQANAERKPKAQFKQDTIGELIDIQSRITEGKGIGYKRWLTKHNLKVMAQTVKLLQEKGLTDEDALNQRIAELETKYHDALAASKAA